MRRFTIASSVVVVLLVALITTIGKNTAAQDHVPPPPVMPGHLLVGTWIVDTDITTETDSPGLRVWTNEGIVLGPQGEAGSWAVADVHTGVVTFTSIFPDGSGSTVIHGPHVVDETGDTWTSDYSWTVVAPDGTVRDSGVSTARGTRLVVEPMGMAGDPLSAMHTWTAQGTPTT
jgi:hypothetical protein